MNAVDFNAVAFDGAVHCKGCLDEGTPLDLVTPIFASAEVDEYPVCDVCGEEHTYMGLTTDGRKTHRLSQTKIDVWSERDRAYVGLDSLKTGETIIEWWDEDVAQAVEDGWISHKNWHQTAFDYAVSLGLIKKG